MESLLQSGTWHLPDADSRTTVEITLLPGVTDTAADALRHAAAQLRIEVTEAATGRRIEFDDGVDIETADEVVRRIVANPVIERWSHGSIDAPHIDGIGETQALAIQFANA